MKWIFLIIISFFLFSCKKEKNNNTSLVGKWKIIEMYEGYVMGGCFCWKPVESENAATIEFSAFGTYRLTQPVHFSVPSCSGTYRVVNDSTLATTSDCQIDPSGEILRSMEKNGNTLIIDYQGFEGVIRYKYRRM